jgi:hypothetical protein
MNKINAPGTYAMARAFNKLECLILNQDSSAADAATDR